VNWKENHWEGQLFRRDDVFFFDESSRDFNELVRGACKAIREDTRWPVPTNRADSQHQANMTESADRFQLNELHNGPVSTSAVLDKKTGRIWVWTNVTDQGGKKTGKTLFLSEDVTPEPESK
jgi:hypothetical protein